MRSPADGEMILRVYGLFNKPRYTFGFMCVNNMVKSDNDEFDELSLHRVRLRVK